MTRWEYKTVSVNTDADEDEWSGMEDLKRLCAEGWEPYAVTLSSSYKDRHSDYTYHVHHLKRPLE